MNYEIWSCDIILDGPVCKKCTGYPIRVVNGVPEFGVFELNRVISYLKITDTHKGKYKLKEVKLIKKLE